MDTARPKWYKDIKLGPLENRPPNFLQIQSIKLKAVPSKHKKRKYSQLAWSFVIAALLISGFSFGLHDYHKSIHNHILQASIPGSKDNKDLQQAILNFRRYIFIQMDHVVPYKDGDLVFYQRQQGDDVFELSADYMKRSFLGGWKWIHGGGFSSGQLPDVAVYYQYLFSPDNSKNPFPLVYGVFRNDQVDRISIQDGQKLNTQAIMFPLNDKQTGWYAFVPPAITHFTIEASNKTGQTVESHIVNTNDDQPVSTTIPNR